MILCNDSDLLTRYLCRCSNNNLIKMSDLLIDGLVLIKVWAVGFLFPA